VGLYKMVGLAYMRRPAHARAGLFGVSTLRSPPVGWALVPTRSARILALLLAAGNANAISLQQAYEAALQHDPAYRMNVFENESAKENRVLGRAGLLPNISASFSGSRNNADQEVVQGGRTFPSHPRYSSRSSAVQLRQPLLNLEAVARYRQGKVQSDQAAAQFEADTAQVALRVVGAYIDALFADDQVALARVQRDMYVEQQRVNQHLFEKGEGTKTDMLETTARLDLAEAQLIEAEDNALALRNTLEGVIGMPAGTLERLGDGVKPAPLTPASFEEWRAIALERNDALAAGRLAVENARLDIDRARAGHAPRVDLVASYSRGDAETLSTYNQNSVNRNVGVQVNIPLFAGGVVNAATRQAVAAHERAKAQLEGQVNTVTIELRKAHSVVLSSVKKIDALLKAVDSSQLLMKATGQSIKGGVRINLDLLNAQQQLYTAQRDLAQARYSYLLGTLRLKATAGTLEREDIRALAAWFR
jgi:protease secretion system outer membrane protein